MSQAHINGGLAPPGESIAKCLEQLAYRTPGTVALEAPDRKPLTFGRLHHFLEESTKRLNSLGIGRHHRVAIVLPNGPEMAVAFLTTAACSVSAPLNPAYRAEEFEFYLADLKANALIIQADFDSSARSVARRLSIPVLELSTDANTEAGLFALSGEGQGPCGEQGFTASSDTALVLHTSGTTSRPKMVPLTHANICISARNVAQTLRLNYEDRCLNVMPLFHIHGLIGAVLSSLLSGASVVCTPGFLAPRFFEWLKVFEPTWYTAVPTMHQSILLQAERHAATVSRRLRLIRSSSAPLAPQVMADLERLFQAPVIEAYGMTEASHQMASNPLPPGVRKPGSVGVAAGPEIAVMDERGNTLPPGSVGEVVIRGLNVMAGYADNPGANDGAFTQGWFRTGDQGYLDEDGYLFLKGRIKEIINRGGEKISPREIDEVLLSHPSVVQALCFAAPHTLLGEEVVAAVVLHEGATVSERDLQEFAAVRLADFKIPKTILLLNEIPKGPTGKLQRIGLAEKLGVKFDLQPMSPQQRDQTSPRTPREQLVAEIAQQVLTIPRIGVYDDLIRLGADSILITQILARIQEKTKRPIPLVGVFEKSTIAGIAEEIEKAEQLKTVPEFSHIQAVPRGETIRLSFAQERMWILHMLEPDKPTYNRPLLAWLDGPIDPRVLEKSLTEIVRRHEVLRTIFPTINGSPVQQILPPAPLRVAFEDYSRESAEDWQRVVLLRSRKETWEPFDLENGPLLRAILMRHREDRHALLLLTHHITFDGWSERILLRELGELYHSFMTGSPPALPILPIQYADFAHWQNRRLGEKSSEGLLSYWGEKLANLEPTELPTDRSRQQSQTYRGERWKIAFGSILVESLRQFSRNERVTLFTTLLTGFQILLHRYTGLDDIVVGSPIAEREQRETENLIGVFINTIVLRGDLSGNPTFREMLGRTREMLHGAFTHHELPFEKLVEALKPRRDPSRTPFFQILFEFRNLPSASIRVPDLEIRACRFDPGIARFDLSVDIFEEDGDLWCAFEYNADLFDKIRIERMSNHYRILLEAALRDPDKRIAALPLLVESERQEILANWNNTCSDYPRDRFLHELFEEQVQRFPDAIAIRDADITLTYRQLDAEANRIAGILKDSGFPPGAFAGISADRSPMTVAGLLGILKAGGAYVPLDPDYPQARLAELIRDAGLNYLLATRRYQGFFTKFDLTVICLEDAPKAPMDNLRGMSPPLRSALQPACVLYTSGSTGTPKGVVICHRNVIRLIFNTQSIRLGAEQKILQAAPLSFDASIFEIWGALLHGGECVLYSESIPTASGLKREILQHAISTMWLTSSLFNSVMDEAPEALCGLDQLLIGGEALSMQHVKRALDALPGTQIINGYGPTECTTFACVYPLPEKLDPSLTSIPIGRPISNTQVYILDKYRNPVPTGVPGELYIGGDGVASGYLNLPEMTVEKFVRNPFSPDSEGRLYRTGDLVRFRFDGDLEFLGRLDRQVKIHGFRIEPEEVETALLKHDAVNQAAVTDNRDPLGGKRLVAYIVSDHSPPPSQNELRDYLKRKLPKFMIPSVFIQLDAIPRNPNGKINWKALPSPEQIGPDLEGIYVAPRTPVEVVVAGIWSDVLGLRNIGIHDDFFSLGGHSLLATKLISRINEAFQLKVPLRFLFDSPTIASLALEVTQILLEDADSGVTNTTTER